MEQWFSPQADESMKMEGMETCLPVHTHRQAQSQELLLTLSQVGISQQTVQYQHRWQTQQAHAAPHLHLGEQVSLFKQMIKS